MVIAIDWKQKLFTEARTHNGWVARCIDDSTLRELYELLKWGPTANNCSPARFVFVRTEEGKERLKPALKPNNHKALAAPVIVIAAYDRRFYDRLPELFPAYDARPLFASNEAVAQAAALRNASLQAAYLMLAARGLGLDCGPMSGFDPQQVNDAFFADGAWQVNFLCALGHGDVSKLRPRGVRLSFEEACRLM